MTHKRNDYKEHEAAADVPDMLDWISKCKRPKNVEKTLLAQSGRQPDAAHEFEVKL